MKTLYPKLKFIYSLPYDRLLTEYENKPFNQRQIKEVKHYIKKFQLKWGGIANSVCLILREIIKNKWQEKVIECYMVKYCRYSGISSPLTTRMEKDFDLVFDTLIHELTHILVSYDLKNTNE